MNECLSDEFTIDALITNVFLLWNSYKKQIYNWTVKNYTSLNFNKI